MAEFKRYHLIVYAIRDGREQEEALLEATNRELAVWLGKLRAAQGQREQAKVYEAREGDTYKVYVWIPLKDGQDVAIVWDDPMLRNTRIANVII